MRLNSRIAANAAAVLVGLAGCGQMAGSRSNPVEGDIRGIEELGSPDLTVLVAGDAVFNATTGVLNVTLQGSESLIEVSKRASDSALLLNGVPVVDTNKTTVALTTALKRFNLTVGANATTVIFDYFNGTFNAGNKPTGSATFGTAGTVVNFGMFTGGALKIRGTSGIDTFYVGQDTAATPNVLISFSTTNADLEVQASTVPSLGFNLGAGNDVFDATSGKGGTLHACASPVSVHGGVGNDTMIGGLGADTLYGDEGLNTIDASSGSATSHTPDSYYGLTTPPSATGTNSTTVTYAAWAGSAGVQVQIMPIATTTSMGVTDNIDDSVGVVIGSPLADTMECSFLTDKPCVLQGGAGDDTLINGLSQVSQEYLYGGDGNDTFLMSIFANKVSLIGGNVSDIATTKNLYVDTVDYSQSLFSGAAVNTTISLNGKGPTTCNAASSTTIPPCPGVADTTPSGFAGALHTDIRQDITVAKCPTGIDSAGVVCTVKANSSGDTIYSGLGSDILTGGTGDDTFVLAAYNTAGTFVAGTASKVLTGGGGNDTADFSARATAVQVMLNCSSATCANSGFANTSLPAASGTAATNAASADTTFNTDAATVDADFAALTAPTPADFAVDSAVDSLYTVVHAAEAAVATSAGAATNSADYLLALQNVALIAPVMATSTSTLSTQTTGNAGLLAAANTALSDAVTEYTALQAYVQVSEGISLVNINNAVCPTGAACQVVTNASADIIDFNGDGPLSGTSLTCNSSNVTTAHSGGLALNCGE